MSGEKSKTREKEVPAYKLELVKSISSSINGHRTFLIASTSKLPSSQFHQIKKNLRGKAEIKVARKSAILRAIEDTGKKGLQSLKEHIHADVALFYSELEPFTLSALLADSQSPTKAKTGDIAPEDIRVEPGPTSLVPGPAISELSGVGLKVAVEGGKLAIKQPHTIVKQGEVIKENVASVMAKLNITPMKVGFEPLAAYDSNDDKVYVGIKIDKKTALENFRDSIARALSFAVGRAYPTKETLTYLLGQAAMHEKAIALKIQDTNTKEGN